MPCIYQSFGTIHLRPIARQAPLSMEFSQARILEWVAIPFSKESSRARDQTWVSYTAGRLFLPSQPPGKPSNQLITVQLRPNSENILNKLKYREISGETLDSAYTLSHPLSCETLPTSVSGSMKLSVCLNTPPGNCKSIMKTTVSMLLQIIIKKRNLNSQFMILTQFKHLPLYGFIFAFLKSEVLFPEATFSSCILGLMVILLLL